MASCSNPAKKGVNNVRAHKKKYMCFVNLSGGFYIGYCSLCKLRNGRVFLGIGVGCSLRINAIKRSGGFFKWGP